MAKEAVFASEAEAEARQALDLIEHLSHHNDNPAYTEQTTRWATPVERLDGKWAYPACAHVDYASLGITLEDIDPSNYPVPEEPQ